MLDLKMASAGDKSKGKVEEGNSNTRKGIASSESEYVKTSRKGFGTDHFITSKDQESWETTRGEHYYGSNAKCSNSNGSKIPSGHRRNIESGPNGSNNVGTVYSRDGETGRGSNSRNRGDESKQLSSDIIEESIDKNNKLKMKMNTVDTRSSHVNYRNDNCFKETENREIEERGEDEKEVEEEEEEEGEEEKEEEEEEEEKREKEEDDECEAEREDVLEEVDINSSEKKENYEKTEYAQGFNKDGFKDMYNKEKGEYKKNVFHNKEHNGSNCRKVCDNSFLSDKEDDGIKKMEVIINEKEEQDQEENEEVEEYEEDFCEEKAEEVKNETKVIYLKNENEEDDVKKEGNYINGDHFPNSNEPFSKNYISESTYIKEDMEETEKKKKLSLITNLLHLKNDDGLANHIRSILGEDNKYIGDSKNSNIHGCNNSSLINSSNNSNDKKFNEHFNIVKNESNSEHSNNCGKHIITKDNWMNMKTLCLNYIRILKRLTNVWSETDKAFEYHFANLLNNESVNILENYLCCFSNIKIHAVKSIFMDSIIECIEELEIMKKLKIPESKIEGMNNDNRDQTDIHKMSKVEFQKKVIEELDSNMSKEIIEEIHHLTMKNPYCNNYNISNAYVSECDSNMQSIYSGMNKHVSFNNETNIYDTKKGQEFHKKNNVGSSFNSIDVCDKNHSGHSCNSHFTSYSNCNANAIDSLIGNNANTNNATYNCMTMSNVHSSNNNSNITGSGSTHFSSSCNDRNNTGNNGSNVSRDFFRSCSSMHNNSNSCMTDSLNMYKPSYNYAEENILNKLNVSIDYNAIADFNSQNYIQEAEKVMERYKCLNKMSTKDNKNNATYKLCNHAELSDVNTCSNVNNNTNANNTNNVNNTNNNNNTNNPNNNTNNTNNVNNTNNASTANNNSMSNMSNNNMNFDANNTNTNKNNSSSNIASNVYLQLKNFFMEQEEKMNKQKYKEANNNGNETTLTKFFQAYPNLLNIFDDKSLSEMYNESELKELKKKCAKKNMDKYDISGCKEIDSYSTSYKMNDEDTCEDKDKLSKMDLDSRLLNTSDITAAGNSSFLNNTNNNIYHNTIGNTIMSSSSSSKNNSSNNSPSISNAIMNANLSYITNNLQKMLKKRKIQETSMVKNSNGGSVSPSAYDLNYLLLCNPNILKKLKMGLLDSKNMLNTGSFNSTNSLNSTGNNSNNSNLANNNNNTNSTNNNNNNNINGGSLCMNGDDFRNKNYSFDYSGSDSGSLNSKKALLYRQSLLNSLKNLKGAYDQNQDTISRRTSFSKLGETLSPNILFDLLLNNNANNANKGLNNMGCDSMLGFGNNTSNISSYGNGNFSVLNGTKHGMNLNCNMSSGGNLKKPYEMVTELSAHLLNGQKPEYSSNIHDLSDMSKNQNNNAGGSNDSSNIWHIKNTKGEVKKSTKNSKLGLGISNNSGGNIRHSRSNSSNSGNSIHSNKGETKVGGGKSVRSGNNTISGTMNTSGISVGVSHNNNLNTGAIAGSHVTSSNVGTGVVVGKLKYEMPEGVNPNDDKVKGVYFSKSPRGVGKWNAYFQIANNKRLFTSFSVSKYGYNEARKLSILKRTQWEKEYNYQGDVKSGDTGRRGKKKAHGNVSNKNNNGKNSNVNNNSNYNRNSLNDTAYTNENTTSTNDLNNSSIGKSGYKYNENSVSSISNFNRETTKSLRDIKNNRDTRSKDMKTGDPWKPEKDEKEEKKEGSSTTNTYYSSYKEESRPLSKRRNLNNSLELMQQVLTDASNSKNKYNNDQSNNHHHIYNHYHRKEGSNVMKLEGHDEETLGECNIDTSLKNYQESSKNDTESYTSIDLIRPSLFSETKILNDEQNSFCNFYVTI